MPDTYTGLRGIFPILYTPFDAEGRIDDEDLGLLIDYMIAAGTHGLAPVGGASECHKLTVKERMWLAERSVAHARGRVPVVVGTSATNTGDAVTLSRHAEEIGAQGVFLTPPILGDATPVSLEHHYGAVAQAITIPIMIQDARVSVSPAQAVALAERYENISYVKEESPLSSGHRISEIKRLRPEMRVLSGGSYLLDDLARGAQGAIPGSVGVSDLSRAYDLWMAGDLDGARAAYSHFTPLSFWRRQFSLLGTKEVLRRLGIFKAAYLREPSGQHLDEQDHRELSQILETMGPPY